jgi:SAM-dependent methyltransferase
MSEAQSPTPGPDWITASGDVWARRWRDTDAALEPVSGPLQSAILASFPSRRFRALDIGCGPGSTTLAVADASHEAMVIACDISPALAAIAEQRTAGRSNVRVVIGDAEEVARREGPFDLLFSRHGVMFFPDPVRAFRALRAAANPGATLVFSCFQSWASNSWASETASAAAGHEQPSPGREPSGFAFADPEYVREILTSAGWTDAEPEPVRFEYRAGQGVDEAMSFLSEIGPASRLLEAMADEDRDPALERMRAVLEAHVRGGAVVFRASAWIWLAKAP